MFDLDSRFLRVGDCFAQKSSKPGRFEYFVTTGPSACLPVSKATYTILVKPSGTKSKGSQHNVTVKGDGIAVVANPANLEIEVGDMVLWHTPDAATPGFAIVGEGAGASFNSSRLALESIYSRAFGVPGRYEWVDAHGGHARGEINVKSLDARQTKNCEQWLATLAKGKLIKISGDKSQPSRLDILAGQTVIWAVEKGKGISITDARLVPNKSAVSAAPSRRKQS